MYDLVLRGGRVIDGSGAPWYEADVAIAAGHIAAIRRQLPAMGARELDVTGLVIAPGFIDTHGHSDVTVLVNPRAESAVRQGITTQVVGQCGFSVGPVRREEIASTKGDSYVFDFEGYEWTWTDIAGYRQELARARPAINILTLVGHGAIRSYVMGMQARHPTADELQEMVYLTEQALEQGAAGLSSGLTYAPGRFCRPEELITLAEGVKRKGGCYHSHMREYRAGFFDSLHESIRVGQEAGVPVVISHINPKDVEIGERGVALIEEARQRGVDVSFDIAPWNRGGGPFAQCLPDWAQDGGFPALKTRLMDPATRRRMADEVEQTMLNTRESLESAWEDNLIAKVGKPENRHWAGRSIAELARERGLPPAEAAMLLLLEDNALFWTAPTIKPQDVIELVLRHPLGTAMTDGMALAPYGPLHQPTMPRSYGTYPRVLGRFVREWHVLSLEAAVHKITAVPANRMGLTDRGLLREGLWADVTVFDPETVIDRETYDDPHQFPAGIVHVAVNGQLVVENGQQLDERSGQAL